MDAGAIKRILDSHVPGAVLDTGKFGRSDYPCVWVAVDSLLKVAKVVSREPGIELNWLENLSAMQVDEAIVLTYFLRSAGTNDTVALRCSVIPESQDAWVSVPSVDSIWPMAKSLEVEVHDLFGVAFTGGPLGRRSGKHILPGDWKGFPLRKSYVYPSAYRGIKHTRSRAGRVSE